MIKLLDYFRYNLSEVLNITLKSAKFKLVKLNFKTI